MRLTEWKKQQQNKYTPSRSRVVILYELKTLMGAWKKIYEGFNKYSAWASIQHSWYNDDDDIHYNNICDQI